MFLVSCDLPAQDLRMLEDSIALCQTRIATADEDHERLAASEKCKEFLRLALSSADAFDYPFESLQTMCTLTSPDAAFRLFNWNIPKNDQTHHYVCFILFPADEKQGSSYIELKELGRQPDKLQSRTFDSDEWLGCLYYAIIPPQKNARDFYTLLAWDGRDRMTNRKYVEAMTISKSDVKFGSAVFKTNNGVQKRMIFEYADEATMSLKYHEDEQRIVFDHLAPRIAGMDGNFSFYGPDLTYDSLDWQKGNWVEQSNIDVRLKKGQDKRPYNDPRKMR